MTAGGHVASAAAQMDIQLVTFFLDSQEYGVDVMRVREIIAMTDITRTANSPGYVRGVINLRGAIVPVISLRSRLGLPDAEDETTSCIAVMDIGGELTGFIIDGISDVFRIRPGELEPPVDVVSQPWIEGILNREQKLVIYLNLANLA